MDKKKIKPRKKVHQLWVQMSPDQYEQFRKAFAASSDKTMTGYATKLLLGKPVRTYYRDSAFDEFTEAAILFRKEASLIIQHIEWTATEKIKLEGMLEEMYQLHLKIHEHARKNIKKPKGT